MTKLIAARTNGVFTVYNRNQASGWRPSCWAIMGPLKMQYKSVQIKGRVTNHVVLLESCVLLLVRPWWICGMGCWWACTDIIRGSMDYFIWEKRNRSEWVYWEVESDWAQFKGGNLGQIHAVGLTTWGGFTGARGAAGEWGVSPLASGSISICCSGADSIGTDLLRLWHFHFRYAAEMMASKSPRVATLMMVNKEGFWPIWGSLNFKIGMGSSRSLTGISARGMFEAFICG